MNSNNDQQTAPILYEYKPYTNKRIGLFKCDINKYDINNGGWQDEIKEIAIIGETKDCFIKMLIPGVGCDRDSEMYGKNYILPIGPHKTRFVNWLPTQTELF